MPKTTNVSGYFNAAHWPIQLVLPRHNITLTLKPGDFILDRKGRKINDPYFEAFAGSAQLAREISETPVLINHMPEAFNKPAEQCDNPDD